MKLKIDMVDPASLKPLHERPRRITTKALAALGRLIDAYGFVEPLIARREDRLLIAGHERLRANALRTRGDRLVPCILLGGLDDHKAAALHVALNNPAAQARYDSDRLAELLKRLLNSGQQADDLARLTALTPRDIGRLLENLQPLPDEPMTPAPQFSRLLDATRASRRATATAQAATSKPAASAVLVFELSAPKFRKAKADFDKLIDRHDLKCNVRIE